MAVLPVRIYGDPVLRKPVQHISDFNEELVNLIDNMVDTMRMEEGIGLAANQVGILKNVIVVDLSVIDERYSPVPFINLEILEKSGSETGEEGCLSLPGIRENIDRAQRIKIRYQDIFGEYKENEFEDLLARVIQHEHDHLHGILLVDRISPLRKQMLNSKLQKLAQMHKSRKVSV